MTADEATIKIAFDMEDIEIKTDSEKLNLLLRIAYMNHSKLLEHGSILFGNGKKGLCERVRVHEKGLWLFFICLGALASFFIQHVMK